MDFAKKQRLAPKSKAAEVSLTNRRGFAKLDKEVGVAGITLSQCFV
jgi:hypothetical protein